MYPQVPTNLRFSKREEEILQFWKDNQINKRIANRKINGPIFTIYDGPPTANGKPHIGHVLTRAIKDIIPRHRAMKGYDVFFKAGWDTHGLPVELEVERKLGIDGKSQIEEYGVEPFIAQCKESVWKYRDEWRTLSDRVAYTADMDNPYVTYYNDYIESEWWALRKLWDKGMLYKGYKVVPYCPRCGTSLSSHEVAQGYKNVEDNSAFVRFAVKGKENTYFAAWTTTPWTLPSNVALCVNPSESYVLVSREEKSCCGESKTVSYWIAEVLAEKLLGENLQLLEKCKGEDLVGQEYEPLFPYANDIVAKQNKKSWYVISDNYVTMSDGTGIVHTAPAFGEDDARVGRTYDLPFVQLVNADGTMTQECEEFAGVFCKSADKGILEKLEKEKFLLKVLPYEHSYPFCWRCDTPLIYYARNSWFIAMTKVRDELVSNNSKVNWIPQNVRDGRFGKFLENVVDWGLSRERYWGTPLPVWVCECGHKHCIGSIEELKSMSKNCPDDIELHKPFIDAVTLTCPECQGDMYRVSEVIDCWFDSGAMAFAQFHYPFENKELFEKHFPAHFISEAQDQTRGWFYSQMAIGTQLFEMSPYENVICLGLILDENGIKMSKHLGNVVDPWKILESHGADAIRWYFYTNSQPWLPSRFSVAALQESQNKFMGTLWNTLAFFTLYANIDKFDPKGLSLDQVTLSVIDRWILSKLQKLIKTVDDGLEAYQVNAPGRAIQSFVDELSNWYVRRSRERFWASGDTEDKRAAFLTLYTVLDTLALLSAPFTPFIAESIWQTLHPNAKDEVEIPSVHAQAWPSFDETFVDSKLEEGMSLLLDIVNMGRSARNLSSMKNRQPLSKLYVVTENPKVLNEELVNLICDELNIKTLEFITDASSLTDYSFKPQLRTLGKKMGKDLQAFRAMLQDLDGLKSYAELKENGSLTFDVNGQKYSLLEDDFIIEMKQRERLATVQDKVTTVALDLTLTEALIEEGLVRELISKTQTMRKRIDFNVTDRINVYYEADDTLTNVVKNYEEALKEDTLSLSWLPLSEVQVTKEANLEAWDINGHPCKLYLILAKA